MTKAAIIMLIVLGISLPALARETQEQNNARATKQMNQTIFQMDQVRESWPQNQDKNKIKKAKKKKKKGCPEGYTTFSVKKNNKTVNECRKDAPPRHRKGNTGY